MEGSREIGPILVDATSNSLANLATSDWRRLIKGIAKIDPAMVRRPSPELRSPSIDNDKLIKIYFLILALNLMLF